MVAICSAGPAEVSGSGEEVFAYHLYRYLSPWLRETGVEKVVVAIGFSKSDANLGTYQVTGNRGRRVYTGWEYPELEEAWRYNQGHIYWESRDGPAISFEVLPLFDGSGESVETLIGFVLIRQEVSLTEAQIERLTAFAAEAVNISRRNGVRLFLDENKDLGVKELLYALMDRFPEWIGLDHSATVMLTHDLDAMTMEPAASGTLNVLAERLFLLSGEEVGQRLVGMAPDLREKEVLGDLVAWHQARVDASYFVYRRDRTGWHREGGSSEALGDWYQLAGRPREMTAIFVPLVHREYGEQDLLGFVGLTFRRDVEPGPGARALLGELGREVARLLRRSVLYTMSVRKMWVVRRVHDAVESAVQSGFAGGLERFIEVVADLIGTHVDVPSFALGYLRGAAGGRELCYVHPRGWSCSDSLTLPVDVAPEERSDSGVSMLAIRLQRPVVLAGGHGAGETLAFRNDLWVNEEEARIYDARAADTSLEHLEVECEPLQNYYRPARESAYATLAYPILFGGESLGVLTVEVDKDTNWIWWTGFGGHLFWDMIVREVATAFYLYFRESIGSDL